VDPAVLASLDLDLIPFMHRSLERRYDMEDPVVAKDGHTYEREAIEAFIRENGKSPISGEPLDVDSLIENRAVQNQIDSYHDAAERAALFQEHATDGTDHPTLSQTLTEADMLAAKELYEEAGNLYTTLITGLQAQLSAASEGIARAALVEKIVVIKQRQAGVAANRGQSSILAAPLIHADGDAAVAAAGSVSLERMRTTTADFEDDAALGMGPGLSPGQRVPSDVSPGPPGVQELLTECAKHNFESQGDEEPVKGKSMWLKYNAGRRRGQWREVWPFNDSVTPPWIANSMGIPPYFRGMEADHIDIHHGRTTKYMLHLVLEISETLPPDWNDSPILGTTSAMSAMTDDSDWTGVGAGAASPVSPAAMQRWAGIEPEPEPELQPQLQQASPRADMMPEASPPRSGRTNGVSPAPVHPVMRGSARDLLRQHEVPEHVADMLEEEDIHTPQTLMDLDDAMVNALGLKLGEKIRLKQAINFAKSCVASDDAGGATPAPPLSPGGGMGLRRADSDTNLRDLLDNDDVDTPTAAAADARYQEAYRGFQKASDISDVGEIKVEEYLSKGTSGTVCKAHWRGMSVAVKRFYYVDEDAELLSSFENEVFLMRELQHANLIRFFAAQCKPPDLCIVMELMLGSLSDLLYGKLSKGVEETLKPKRQLAIVKGVAAGMLFLHDHGVCHRDLKSANVLFNRHLDVKLCDFAFSKFKQQASMSARFETSVGTPAWMAPEVLRGDEYTLLADVYSFGVILWEIVCREAPFAELNRFQIIFQVGTQGVQLQLPSGTATIWVAISKACWREKPAAAKSRRPTFRQIVDVLSAAQEQLKTGVSLDAGAGMEAWDASEVVREEEYTREMRALGVQAESELPALHAGITEDLQGEAEAAEDDEDTQRNAETVVTPADPDAAPATPLARVTPRRGLSSPAMQSPVAAPSSPPPPVSPRDGA